MAPTGRSMSLNKPRLECRCRPSGKAVDRRSTGGETRRAQTKRAAKCVKAEVSERGGVRPEQNTTACSSTQ